MKIHSTMQWTDTQGQWHSLLAPSPVPLVEDKVFIGSGQSRMKTGRHHSLMESSGSSVKGSWDQPPDFDIGSSSCFSKTNNPSAPYDAYSLRQDTMNSLDQIRQRNMFKKKTPESPTPSSNTESNLSNAMHRRIGRLSGTPPKEVISLPSPQIFESIPIVLSAALLPTFLSLLQLKKWFFATGELLVLASLEPHGTKQDLIVTLRIPEPSFGAGTRVRRMLSSMNFEVVSTLATYSDGSTGTPLLWKLKEAPPHSESSGSGSPQILRQSRGTQI